MQSNPLNEKPDLAYIKKILWRQKKPALILGSLIFISGLIIAFNIKNIYRSSISVVLDSRDTQNEPYSGKAWANATQRNFEIKFQSQEFIQRIITEAKIEEEPTILKKIGLSKTKKSGDPAIQNSNSSRDISLIRKVMSVITASNERDDGALSLTVDWNSPDEAQRIASHAIDLWILSELEDETTLAKRRLDGLVTKKIPRNEAPKKENRSITEQSSQKPDPLETAQKIEILNRQIREITDQLSAQNSEVRRRRINLEVDLERLRSKFLATHPDIESKEAELKALSDSRSANDDLTNELDQKRTELIAFQLKSNPGFEVSSLSAPNALTNAIVVSQLQSYIALLERQIRHPELRSRFNVIKAATYENAAFRRRKLTTAIFGTALSILSALAMIIYRELNNQLARDAWRVEMTCGVPVWGQISTHSLLKHGFISPETADLMREKLGRESDLDDDSRALLGYRKIEIAMRRRCSGKSVILIEGSSKSDLRGFYTSLINIITSDMAGKILFIDANHVTPLNSSENGTGFLDMIDAFNTGNDNWKNIIQSGEKSGRLYDFLCAGSAPKGLRTRLYNEKILNCAFNELDKIYDLIIVRGLPETHFVENSALVAISSDSLMIVDSTTTTMTQISRSIDQLGESPIRGLVLVGT